MVCAVCSAVRLSTPAPPEPLPHLYASANQLQQHEGGANGNMTQTRPGTALFRIAYYGTPDNEGSVSASGLASVLIGMSSLIDAANTAVNTGSASASLHVRSIGSGSIEIQFAIEMLQVSVNLAFTAEDLIKVLFGSAGVGGVLTMFKQLRGREPEKVTEHDAQTVRIESTDGSSFLGHPVAFVLYQEPETRRGVQLIVGPLAEFNLDTLIIRDNNGDLVEVTRDEAYQLGVTESEKRELDMVEAVREELQTGFDQVNERIDKDIADWALLGRMVGEINDRLDEIGKRLP